MNEHSENADYGLRREILSPMETLAQSVSTMAPTTTPAATIPLVCALAGNGTWLAYVLATVAVLLVALCISRYARHSSSPGSLYAYASMTLPPWLGATVAWSLLLAYVATGSSVIGGFYHYANLLLRDATGHVYSAVLLAVLVTGVSIWIAYRDVKISARLMLWIEAASVTVIVIVVTLLLVRHGWHLDAEQLHLRGMTGSGLRLGLVLALFSFVGFRERDHAGLRGAQSAENDSSRGHPKRHSCRSFFHDLCLRRSVGVPHCGPGFRREPSPDVSAGSSRRRPGLGTSDRYRRARKPVCRNSGMHHSSGTRAHADGAQRACPRLSGQHACPGIERQAGRSS